MHMQNLPFYLEQAGVLDKVAPDFATIALFSACDYINRNPVPESYTHMPAHVTSILLKMRPFISDRPDLLAGVNSLAKMMAITREMLLIPKELSLYTEL